MKVIITNRFDKIYLKYNTKYFNANELSENLKDKHFNFISLHHPYFKFKIKIDSVSFRGIVAVIDGDKIIPLMIALKKNKIHGENINWRDFRDDILKEYDKSIEEIENGYFQTF